MLFSQGRAALLCAGLVLWVAGCRDLSVPDSKVGAVDGTVVANNQPVAGLKLTLTPESGEAPTVTTAADGHFQLEAMAPGVWALSGQLDGYLPLERTFTIASGQTRSLGTLTLFSLANDEAAGTVSGTIEVAGAMSGSAQGATVEALLQPGMTLLATTGIGASGVFALQVPPGTYSLRVSHPYFVNAMKTDVVVTPRSLVALPNGALVLQLNPGRVVGKVVEEVDGQTTRAPAAGVSITSDTGAATTTASDGTFTLGGLPGGARTLRFTKTDRHGVVDTVAVAVTAGADVTLPQDVELLLDRGDVQGQLEMGDGTPLRDVTVAIDGTSYSSPGAPDAMAPAKGSFRIAGVPVGDYSLTGRRSGYRNVSSGTFHVSANRQTPVPALPLFTRVQGDFNIDDADATSAPGFTRVRTVLLTVNDPGGVASWRAAEGDPTSLTFSPFGADGGTSISFDLTTPGDGEKTVFLQLRDAMGNVGAVLSASIVLDTTAPTDVALQLGDGSGFIGVSDDFPFTLTGRDPGGSTASSGLGFMKLATSLDAQNAPNAARATYVRADAFHRASTAQGPVTLYAQLIDNAGNASAVVNVTTVVDTVAPTGTLTVQQGTGAESGFTANPIVTLLVTAAAEPNGGTLRVRIGNSALELNTATPQVSASVLTGFLDQSTDGAKQVFYRFVDSAGNQSAPASASITLDRQAPAPFAPSLVLATLSSPAITNTVSGSFTATVLDDRKLSTTQAVQLELDGVAQTPTAPTAAASVTGPLPFTLPASDGLHTVRLTFKDAAGNTASTPLTTVTLDRVAPTGRFALVGRTADNLPVTSDTMNAVVASQTVRVDLVQDGASGVFLSTSAIANCAAVPAASFVAPGSASLTSFDLGATGVITVRGCLRDAAGNVTTLTNAQLTVDTSSPGGCTLQLPGVGLNGVTPPVGQTAQRGVAASLTGCTETPVEVALVESGSALVCTTVGLPWAPLSSLAGLQLGADGAHTFQACVRDAAHNTAGVTPATVTLDTTPPTGAAVVINAGATFVNAAAVTGGTTTLSLVGQAVGAVDWAISTTAGGGGYLPFTAGVSRALPSVAAADGATLTAFARFRDAVGNVSDANDTIVVDSSGPGAPVVTVRPTGQPGFINNEVATVQMTAVGAASVQLAEGVDLATCNTALGSAASLGVLASYTQVISGSDGLHTVCARSTDAAGNTSPVGSTTVTLDRVAPSQPVFVTQSSTFNPNTGSAAAIVYKVHARNVVDPQHFAWKYVGGAQSTLSVVTPGALEMVNGFSALPFMVSLNSHTGAGYEAGDRNQLSLYEVDNAGNVSAPAMLTLVLDGTAPTGVRLNQLWVSNGPTSARLQWTPSASPDVVAYRVYYGTSSAGMTAPDQVYFGNYATQGTSPFDIPAAPSSSGQQLQLTGLPQGALTFLTVFPIDAAGNVGAGPLATGPAELVLEPNVVSPNFVSEQTLFPDAGNPDGGGLLLMGAPTFETSGDLVYAAAASSTGHLVLNTIDTTLVASSFVQGTFGSGRPPAPRASTVLSDGPTVPYQVSMKLEFPWLFTASGSHIRIFNVASGSPVLVSDLDCRPPTLGVTVSTFMSLEVRGNNLFATGWTGFTDIVVNVDVSALYDNVAGAPVFPGALRAALQNFASQPNELLWSRDRLSSPLANANVMYDLTNALDNNVSTNISITDRFSTSLLYTPARFCPVTAGDLALVSNNGLLSVVSLQNFWAKTTPLLSEVARTNFSGSGQVAMLGEQVYLASNSAPNRLQVLDLSTPAAPAIVGDKRSDGPSQQNAGSALAVLGNYAYVGTTGSANASLRTYELASPSSLHSVFSSGYAMATPLVTPGYVVGASGVVYDMLNPAPTRRTTATTPESCVADGVVVDDTLISLRPAFNDFRILRLDESHGRVASPSSVTSASTIFSPPVAERPLSIDRIGNYAVVVAARATAPTSLWLEVYRLSALRSQATNAVRTLTSADKIGEYQFDTTALALSSTKLRVRMNNNLAVIANGAPGLPSEPTAWIIDVAPLIDDVPGTTMGTNQVVGRLVHGTNYVSASEARLAGSVLYLAGSDSTTLKVGLFTFNAAAAYDGNVSTKVSWADGLVDPLVNVAGASALDVQGSTLVMLATGTGISADVLYAFDVSTPDEPFRLGEVPMTRGASPCIGQPSFVKLAGTRVYVGADSHFDIIELE